MTPDTIITIYEVVRLVAQEANPLQEQILIFTEEGAGREPAVTFSRREIGAEESMGSIELLGVLRVRSSGRLAVLLRRERESGFVLEWIERSARGTWSVRWRSARFIGVNLAGPAPSSTDSLGRDPRHHGATA